jgi:hypothetical protein
MKKTADWNALAAKARGMTICALEYSIRDCVATIRAWPDGENAGYYSDEASIYRTELNRRRAGK